MKYLFLSLAIILGSHYQLSAQSTNHVNAGAGYIYSSTLVGIENSLLIGIALPKPKAGFYVSFAYEHQLSKLFTGQVEVNFQQKGYQYLSLVEQKVVTNQYNYIGISPTIGFRPMNKLSVFIGPELNFLTNQSDGKPVEFGLTGRGRYQFNRVSVTAGYFRALTMYQLSTSGTFSFTNQNWNVGLLYQLM